MFSQKTIVVTVGNNGSIVNFFSGSSISNKIFLEELNDTTKDELKKILSKNKTQQIYLLLDTIDQSYKKKFYPNIHKQDVKRLVRREMLSSGDHTSLQNFLIFDKKDYLDAKEKSSKRWECLFVSASNDKKISDWVDFLSDLPNQFAGIHMMPIEAFSLCQKIKPKNLKKPSEPQNKNLKLPKKDEIFCLILQNKVSGFRQIVFSNDGIIFTRVVDYNISSNDFNEKYEQDIYTTFEYLKRLSPNSNIEDFQVINILPEEALKKIKLSQNIELKIINYTPYEAALRSGLPNLLPQNAAFCDILLAKMFAKEKKILKFTNSKLAILDKLYFTIFLSRYLNLGLLLAISLTFVSMIFSIMETKNTIHIKETLKYSSLGELNRLERSTIQGAAMVEKEKEIDIEKAADFGRIEEFLGTKNPSFTKLYLDLKVLREFNIKLNSISYSIPEFQAGSPPLKMNRQTKFTGDIINKSGDIESLFREFDSFTAEIKGKYNKDQVRLSEIPRTIDFNQKYYSFPIDFTIIQNR